MVLGFGLHLAKTSLDSIILIVKHKSHREPWQFRCDFCLVVDFGDGEVSINCLPDLFRIVVHEFADFYEGDKPELFPA